MSINLLKKLVSSAVLPDTVRPEQRKPPQRAHTVPASREQVAESSRARVPESHQNTDEKILIPGTWNEVIGNPRVWAEIRPLIVDED